MKSLAFIAAFLAVLLIGFWAASPPASQEADARALLVARQAYAVSQAYFAETGGAKASVMALLSLGLVIPEGISLELVNGNREFLSIRCSHVKGGVVYGIDALGNVNTLPRGRMARFFSRFADSPETGGGKSWQPHPADFQRPYQAYPDSHPCGGARIAARNAFSSAQYFFSSNPGSRLKKEDLGYYSSCNRSDGIVVEVLDGTQEGLRIRARHPETGEIWEVDARGRLTSPAQDGRANPKAAALKPPSAEKIRDEGDLEAKETAIKVFELSRRYLSEFNPSSGLRLDALKRAFPEYSIPPDVTVEVLDRRAQSLRLKVWHRNGGKAFEVGPDGAMKASPFTPDKSRL